MKTRTIFSAVRTFVERLDLEIQEEFRRKRKRYQATAFQKAVAPAGILLMALSQAFGQPDLIQFSPSIFRVDEDAGTATIGMVRHGDTNLSIRGGLCHQGWQRLARI